MATTLNYDNQGFIVGLGRVENNTKQLHNDTQEILKLLLAQRNAGNNSLQDMTQTLDSINTSLDRLPKSINRGKTKEYMPRKSPRSNNPTTPRIQRKTKEYGGNNPRPRNRTTTANPQNTKSTLDRQRDAGGRFAAKAEDAKFVDKLSNKLGDTFGKHFNVDDKNLDPLIDSFHEMKDVLSPISGVLGYIRDKAEQRRERKHDKAVEDNLETIAENTSGGGGKSGKGGKGGGFLGGLAGRLAGGALGGIGGMAIGALGGVGKMATKMGGKKLGILGTLLGAGSLAMNWGDMSHEQKSAGIGGLAGGAGGAWAGATAGAAIGSVVPVIGTAIGGVVGGLIGGWLGSEGGEVLGKTASPYIQSWTNSLQQYSLGDKLKTAFDFGMNPFFFGITRLLPPLNDWVAKTTGVDVAKGFTDLWNEIKAKLGFGSPTKPTSPSGSAGGVSGSDMIAGEGWSAGMGGGTPSWFSTNTDAQRQKVREAGLIKSPESDYTKSHSGIYNAALMAHDVLGSAYQRSASFSDKYHRTHNPNSFHNKGLAFDMTIDKRKKSIQQSQAEMKDKFEKLGLRVVTEDDIRASSGKLNQRSGDVYLRDEEKYATGHTTAPHLHANFTSNAAADKFNRGLGGGATGSSSSSGSRVSSGLKGNQQRAYNSARANGLSDTAARALVANMSGESLSNPSDTTGDHGTAQGIVQWHPDRARAIQKRFGKLPKDMSVEEQTSAAIWEMKTNPAYRATWNALNGGGSAESMVGTLVRNYERPGDTNKAIGQRVQHLRSLNVAGGQDLPQSTKLQALATSKKGLTLASIPVSKKEKIPKPQPVTQKVSSDDDNDDKKGGFISNLAIGSYIAQNVSDRGIAHGVTGGLGEDRFWI